ncbi:MAG: class I SAM-dependent methyltransferase [Lachnospiraceae bacterium]|nr:class I SAM-dependent methyltransferase [Lachnospiraceae bacterium]
MKCRCCGSNNIEEILDLGLQPLSNDYIAKDKLSKAQYFIPLRVGVCKDCWLCQVLDYEMPEKIFNEEYKYFSSFSSTWLKHCKDYVDMIVKRLKLDATSRVLEVASNDGYLLQYFKEYGIEPLGVDPARATAEVAMLKGINTIVEFWSERFARRLDKKFDLILGNNVLAHVPDINDFVKGLKIGLASGGTITIEFPQLVPLLENCYFDTIYHEHFSYLSFTSVNNVFKRCGLKLYDVEEQETHGGSLRIYATHDDNDSIVIRDSVALKLKSEHEIGIDNIDIYRLFSQKVRNIKYDSLERLISYKRDGMRIAGYGAAAKGNTFLNYVGAGKEFIDYVVDASPYKQGSFLPGTQIPIYDLDTIKETKPDVVIIIPWNIKDEIRELLSFVKSWGGKIITLMPTIEEF